ncbi:MAG: hypothetical protein WD068_00930 [Candidatus Babeliales bacterium]
MKRFLIAMILVSFLSTLQAETAAANAGKERIKSFGSTAFSAGGAVYLVASYCENYYFERLKNQYYTSDHLGSLPKYDRLEAGSITTAFKVSRTVRYLATGSLIAGAFLLGMSLEDSFNLV